MAFLTPNRSPKAYCTANDHCSAPLCVYWDEMNFVVLSRIPKVYWTANGMTTAPGSLIVSYPFHPFPCLCRSLPGNALLAIRDGMDFVVPSRSPKAYWTANDDCSFLFGVNCNDQGHVIVICSPKAYWTANDDCSYLFGVNCNDQGNVIVIRSPKANWTANDECSYLFGVNCNDQGDLIVMTSPCYHRQLISLNTHLSSPFLSEVDSKVSSCTYTPSFESTQKSPCYHRQLISLNTHLSSPFLSVSSCTYTPHPPLFATRYLCIALGPLPAAMARIPLVISACVVSTCFFSLTPHPPLFATRYLCSALGPLPAAIGNLTCIVCLFFVLYACPPSPFIPILTRYLFNALGPLPAAIGNLTCIVPLQCTGASPCCHRQPHLYPSPSVPYACSPAPDSVILLSPLPPHPILTRYLFNALGPLPAAIGNLTFLSAM
ncbi:unnamed protein product [Closterium sp. NIES-54]